MFFLPENLGCFSVRGHLILFLIQRGYETDFSFFYPRSKSFSLVPKTPFRLPLVINNGNRTEWSPIRSVIRRVINKIGRPRSGSPICLSRV